MSGRNAIQSDGVGTLLGDGDAHVKEHAAGLTAGPAPILGLLDLKIFADAGMTHGWLHAHGVIVYESMRRSRPP